MKRLSTDARERERQQAAIDTRGGDLQLLTGIAEVSAAPLANALKMEQLERHNERLLTELAVAWEWGGEIRTERRIRSAHIPREPA